MKIVLLVVGKTNNQHLHSLINEYQQRLKHYNIGFDVNVIPDIKNAKNLSEKQQKYNEGQLIMKNVAQTDFVVLLDEHGKDYSSVRFSEWISHKMICAVKRIVFIIGGSYGFDEYVYKRANDLISLSKMTFSHQMVRLIFIEQLYRAMTILNNEPYHHE